MGVLLIIVCLGSLEEPISRCVYLVPSVLSTGGDTAAEELKTVPHKQLRTSWET